MNIKAIRFSFVVLVTLAVMAVSAVAQEATVDGIPVSQLSIATTKVTDNLYILSGVAPPVPGTDATASRYGGTVGVLTGPDGIFMVDAQYSPMDISQKVLAAIRQFSDAPIRFLANTHHHGDHTGGNAFFAKMGATILSRPELRARLLRNRNTPVETRALATYKGTVTFHVNGEEIELIPMPRGAHTDNDAVIYFKNADVVMMGDMARVGYPNGLGSASGGNISGLIDAYAIVIGFSGPNTKIIPGHAPLGEFWDRDHLIEYRDMMVVTRDRLAKLILEEGKTLEEVWALRPLADYDLQVMRSISYVASSYDEGMYPRFVNSFQYIRTTYNQLKGENIPSPLPRVGTPERLAGTVPSPELPR